MAFHRHARPVSLLWGWVRARKSQPPHPCPAPSPSPEHPPPHAPCTLRPVFWGCCRREGRTESYCTTSSQRNREGGRGPGSPSPQLSAPPHGSPSFSPNVLPRGPHLKPCPQPQNPRPEARPVPPHLGGACCVRARVLGRGALPQVPAATGGAQAQRPFPEPVPRLPPKHKATQQADFGVSVYCKGFCRLVGFLVISLCLGDGVGGLRMQGSAPVLSQRPIGLPPLLQHMCTTCKVSPPSRKKQPPQPVKWQGVQKEGTGPSSSPKRESKLKKI